MQKTNIHKSDLSLLLVFHTIYREGSLSKAALTLNLTQPAVSHALARLRQRLNDPLFVRAGHQMLPTALAREMAQSVGDGLALLDAVWSPDVDFQPEHAVFEFRIGMRDVLEAMLLPKLMQRLRHDAPGIRLMSVRMDRRSIPILLASEQLDLAVDVFMPIDGPIQHRPLTTESLVVVAGSAFVGTSLDMNRYLQAEHVLVSSRRQGLSLEDYALQQQGLSRRIVLRCQHYYAACQVVSGTNLLLTMPGHYACVLNRHSENRLFPIPFEVSDVQVHLYWHVRRQSDAAHQWMRQLIWEAASMQQLISEQVPAGNLANHND